MKFRKKVILAIIIIILIVSINLPGIVKSLVHYETIKKYSKLYDVDPALVVSIIYAESGFAPHAKSRKGAIGLMQVMPSTFKELSGELNLGSDEAVLKSPETNIRVGIYYISKLKKQGIKSDIELLSAYNAGKSKTLAWKKESGNILTTDSIPYKETREYIKRIQRTYRWLKKII